MVDYYKTLEVSKTSSEGEIKKSYRKLALKWHPDKNPDNLDEANRRFRELSEAYEVLIDPKKRQIYDRYGKDGLVGSHNGDGHRSGGYHGMHGGFDEFDVMGGFPFVFRPPEDVFREFFGVNSPFADLFREVHRAESHHGRHSNGSGGRHHRHSHDPMAAANANNITLASFMAPMGGYSMMDFHIPPGQNSFTSFSSFCSDGFGSGGGGGNGGVGVKRTSTSTKFINGKKIKTKRVFENGQETVFSYENDVLKSQTVNGVEKLNSIKN